MIVIDHISKRYGATGRRRRPHLRRETRCRHRIPRTERRRQVHHHADDHRAGPARIPARSPSTAAATPNTVAPIHEVGALLEAKAVHPARSARNHLLADRRDHRGHRQAGRRGARSGRPDRRGRPAGRRLLPGHVAAARASPVRCSADPQILLFDEPVNGLDPEGILWIRGLLGDLAAQGRTVFVSSHLITELGAVAEHLVIIGRGRLIAEIPMSELGAGAAQRAVHVRSPQAGQLAELIGGEGIVDPDRGRPRRHRDQRTRLADHRRARGRGRDRAVRADPAHRLAGAGLHGPHPGRDRLPRPSRRPDASRTRPERRLMSSSTSESSIGNPGSTPRPRRPGRVRRTERRPSWPSPSDG